MLGVVMTITTEVSYHIYTARTATKYSNIDKDRVSQLMFWHSGLKLRWGSNFSKSLQQQ